MCYNNICSWDIILYRFETVYTGMYSGWILGVYYKLISKVNTGKNKHFTRGYRFSPLGRGQVCWRIGRLVFILLPRDLMRVYC